MPWRGIGVAIAVIVASLIVLGRASGFVVDWAWFSTIGYVGVFWTVFATKAVLFVAVFAVSTLLLWVNGTLALRFASQRRLRLPAALDPGFATVRALPGTPTELFGPASPLLPWRLLILAVALVIGLLIAMGETGKWDLILRFIYQVPYGQNDPLFGKDIGFYLFSLPVYVALKNWMLLILLLSTLMAGAVYFVHGEIDLDRRPWRISPAAIAHGSALLGLYFAVKAWSYALDRYLLLYDDNGVVVGAGYTDVHVELPVLWLLIGLAAAAAVVAWANVRLRTYRLAIAAAALVFGGSFVFAELFPGLFQRFFVKPSELQLEAPYIQRNIALTREAYNLRQITVKPFPAEQGLTFQSLQDNRGTIDNIRLWDWQPLMDTYAQLQEIRTYYKFLDVDVDRYQIDGSYQQVTLAARELAPSLLSANAQTWVNLHLLFTHGNGVVMSPVTQKSAEGLPNFYLKDIPPVASGGPGITEPRIYFGQSAGGYVIVKGSTPEFDYPKGKDNVYANYDGADGIPIGGTAWRTLFAWYFDDVNILLSRYITGESRIMLHRNIQDRVQTIAPFLQLDRDPYVVISDGRLYWMQDAYTTSGWFPYAQPQPDGDTNYIRNSVKVVIDAYNGTVAFYVVDAADPIVATYRRIFPALFKPFDAMPPDLQKHIRYPEDLFASRLCSTARITWTRPKCSTIARISGSSRASRPAPTASTAPTAPGWRLLHHDAPARRTARRVLPHAAHGAEPAGEHDRLAGRALRSARLRQAHRLRVPQGQTRLRPVPDRGAHQPEHRDLAADLAVEPDGLASHSRKPSGRADRELDPVCVAAVSARGVGPVAGTQAGDRGLRRPCGDGGDASCGPGRAVQGIRPGCRPAGSAGASSAGPADERPARRSSIMIGRSIG